MHAVDADSHNLRARPADVPVLPGESCLVTLRVSIDQDKTWQDSGTLNLPTVRYEAASRLFLMTATAMTTDEHASSMLWQALAWAVEEGQTVAPGAQPIVSLRSDGEAA